MSEKIYAVLTGDIVKSRALAVDQLKALQLRLKSAVQEFATVFPGVVAGALEITRGDGWQVALQKPEHALRMALYLRAVVQSEFKTDTRVSIGTGPVDRLDPDHIIESTGLAFEHSGHGLELMKKKQRISFFGNLPGGSVIARLLDCLAGRWSERQAFVAAHSFLQKTQDEIAKVSPINSQTGKPPTRQAVAKTQDQIHLDVLEDTFYQIENQPLRVALGHSNL